MKLASKIEQTILKPTLSEEELMLFLDDVKQHEYFGVCIPPWWVKKTKREVSEKGISVVTVVGFPLGYQRTEVKLEEIKCALKDGADEIDMVMNMSAWKSGMEQWILQEWSRCAQLVHEHEKLIKIILETAYLTPDEIAQCANLATRCGIDFVKTSTGMASRGASIEDITLLRKVLPTDVGIKASGGIHTAGFAIELINAGADRIGTSQGAKILKEAQFLRV